MFERAVYGVDWAALAAFAARGMLTVKRPFEPFLRLDQLRPTLLRLRSAPHYTQRQRNARIHYELDETKS